MDVLLRETSNEGDRTRLGLAWERLGLLLKGGAESAAPSPSVELARVFSGSSDTLSEEELYMLAAAGIEPSAGADGTPLGGEARRAGEDAGPVGREWIEDTAPGPDPAEGACGEPRAEPSAEAPACEGDLFVLAPGPAGGRGEERIEGFDPGCDRLLFQGVGPAELSVEPDGEGGTRLLFRGGAGVLVGVELTPEQVLALSDFQ
ncbi:MAG: hypothetical protein AB7D51_04830 [Desulfovibrionaceae bacterium]